MSDTPERNAAEDAKRRFKEALERNSRASRAQEAHENGRVKVKNMSGPAGQKRFFRRKTG
ncbi:MULTISPECIES: DUF5302 domain-containing protein [unclassified Streptomyces]|uniref:DUF5302 domain-containing protein n=1 Tax=unclassified Streptomyces TaxID=2593676 RepID=UPI00362F3B4F